MYIEGDSIDDTNMRFGGGLVRHKGDLLYVERIHSINSNTVNATVAKWNTRTGELGDNKRMTLLLKEVDWSRPSTRYVTVKGSDTCYLVAKRAVNRGYSHVTKTNNTEIRVPTLDMGRGTFPMLATALANVDTPHLSVEEAWKAIQKGVDCCAITDRVALGNKYGKTWVYLLHNVVGEAVKEKNINLIYQHRFFRDELEELGYNITLIKEDDV